MAELDLGGIPPGPEVSGYNKKFLTAVATCYLKQRQTILKRAIEGYNSNFSWQSELSGLKTATVSPTTPSNYFKLVYQWEYTKGCWTIWVQALNTKFYVERLAPDLMSYSVNIDWKQYETIWGYVTNHIHTDPTFKEEFAVDVAKQFQPIRTHIMETLAVMPYATTVCHLVGVPPSVVTFEKQLQFRRFVVERGAL
jgi:hypothetical protein